ncbi:MAG TPA: double-strand break repair protein AddB [Microvirga sp.]
MRSPRVFTIPPGSPFLPTLVDALFEGRVVPGIDGPVPLAEATIYLPTRRAARALALLIAERAGGDAQLLPRIVPLGEAEEAEFELLAGAMPDDEILVPPVGPLERRLILTRLVQKWSAQVDREMLRLGADVPFLVPSSPADAVGLAGDLEALMDSFTTEGVPWDRLGSAVDMEFSEYFRITSAFVAIASEAWPAILRERQASDPAQRRTALLRAEVDRLRRGKATGPVIAAGSTGSVPATAALLSAIAGLPNGAVILPGLDQGLDEASWTAISGDDGEHPTPGHPQAMLHRLLGQHLKIERSDVIALAQSPPALAARERLLSEALRPAETTDGWAAMTPDARKALAEAGCRGIALVEAADEREEALAIAIALREVLDHPGRTAALVTPDRALAARVAAELGRWGVLVEDSAGLALSDTGMGRLARLAADAAAQDFHPVRVLALLAHPAVRLGWERAQVERASGILEIGVLRGPAPAKGLDGLRRALMERRTGSDRHTPRPARRLTAEDWDLAAALVERLIDSFQAFSAETVGEARVDLLALAQTHRHVVEALARGEDGEPPGDEDGSGEALFTLFDDLAVSGMADGGRGGIAGRFVDYPAFFTALAKQCTLTLASRTTHRRVKILGLLEARLLAADRVVLGGLDEGVWPPRTETDAFLNRPMRAAIGLSSPERRIGQTAHDFVQAMGHEEVVITRALKRDSSPMVPSRLLQRIKAFAGEEAWRRMGAAGHRYRALAQRLDAPLVAPQPASRPAPKPDPILIPRTLSVTEVETLVRDPYAIYAKHILKLDGLEPIAVIPSHANRGTIIHEALGRFAEAAPERLPAEPLPLLLQFGQDAFGTLADSYPELYAEWWPRFERLAVEFVKWEERRRGSIARVHPEVSGAWTIPLGPVTFTLRARADRIERHRDGTCTIVDFKTGSPPGVKEVFAGFAPQLTLEAAMLMHGAFRDLPATTVTPSLLYVHTSGGRKALNEREIDTPRGDERSVADLVADHQARLKGMLARYYTGEIGFMSRPYPKYASRYSRYDHLARVKEWSLSTGGDE